MNVSYHLPDFAALPMKFRANRLMPQQPHRCAKRRAISILLLMLGTGCSAAEPVPTPIPTPTSLPEPVVGVTSMPAPTEEAELQEGVLYEDDFSNITSGWPNELEFDNYYIGYHEPDFYHVEVHEPNDSAVVVIPGESFDDLTVEAEVLVSEANTDPSGNFRYGLVVRRSGNLYYAFTISPRTQSWYVLKSTPTGLEVLEEGADDSIQGLVEVDTLRVDAQGPAFTFHINGRLVSRVHDPDYAGGEVGFVVETFDGPRAHIHYDDLTIREVEAPPVLCTVMVGLLNIRYGPGIAFTPPIDVLSEGTRLEPLARNPDALWIQVWVPESGQTGWVRATSSYVSCDVSVVELPAIAPPSTPVGSAP